MTDLEYLKKYYDGNLDQAILELKKGRPVQYIVGNVDFYGINLNVNEDVLIPRFETEELIYKTLAYLNDKDNSILDIGTGSGAIAITLKLKLPNSKVTATDISKPALNVAKANALKNDAEIEFIHSNIFSNVLGKYDLIISNPPYIDPNSKADEIVHSNEPHLALYAEDNGLYFYRQILKEAKLYLNKNGIIAFEIGYNQGKEIEKLARKYFPSKKILIEKDVQGKDRFVFII